MKAGIVDAHATISASAAARRAINASSLQRSRWSCRVASAASPFRRVARASSRCAVLIARMLSRIRVIAVPSAS